MTGLLISMMSLLGADLFQDTFNSANTHYQNQDYAAAIQDYERLIASGVVAEEVFYNLGNAFHHAGDPGAAIANYERVLHLNPNHLLARENLGLVLKTTERNLAKPGGRPWEETLLFWDDGLHLNTVFYATIIFWLLSWLCLMMRHWRGLPYGRGLASVLGIVALLCLLSTYAKIYPTQYAVAQDETVPVRYGTDLSQAVRFELHAGDRVLIDGQEADWLRIVTVDEERGWVPKDAMALAGPPYGSMDNVEQ